MKKKRTAIIFITVMMLLVFAGCSSQPKTVEAYLNKDASTMQEINDTAEQAGMTVEIKDNDITYNYDISTMDGVTEEIAKSDAIKESLDSALETAGGTFSGLCADIEEKTKINGVRIIVKYNFKGDVITERTFTATDK